MTLDQYLSAHGVRPTHLARAVGVRHSTIIRIARREWEPKAPLRAKIVEATNGLVAETDLLLSAIPSKQDAA